MAQVGDRASSQVAGFLGDPINRQERVLGMSNLGYVYRAPTVRGSLVIALGYNRVNTFERGLRFGGRNSATSISSSFLPYPEEYSLDGLDLAELNDIPFAAFNGGFIEFYHEILEQNPDMIPFYHAVAPGTTINQEGLVREEGNMQEINLGGALEVAVGVMVGLSVNVPFGSYDYNSTFEEEDVDNTNTAVDYTIIQDNGNLLEGFHFLSYRQFVQSDMVGINLRLGVSMNRGKNVRAGITVETPTRYFVEESYGIRFFTEFDNGGTLNYGEQSDHVGNGSFDYQLITPWKLGAGLQYTMSGLTLLADMEFVTWNQLHYNVDTERAYFEDVNQGIEENFSSTFNLRMGSELRLEDITLRGGVALIPHPRQTNLQHSDGSRIDQDRLYYAAGIGYDISQHFQVNLGWMYTRFESAYLAYPGDNLGQRQENPLLIDESITQNQFILGMIYQF